MTPTLGPQSFASAMRVGHVPDERRRRRSAGASLAEVERTEELESEANLRSLQHLGDGGQAVAHDLELLVSGRGRRGRQDEHHLVAADAGRERGIVSQLLQRFLKGRLFAAEGQGPRHRHVDDGRLDLQFREQRLGRVESRGLGRTEIPVDAAVAGGGREADLGVATDAAGQRSVQRDEPAAFRLAEVGGQVAGSPDRRRARPRDAQ